MKLVIALNFMVLALIMMGLFFIVQVNYGRLTQSSKYWSVALLCDATGLALLGGLFLVIPDFDHSNWLGTLANSLLFSAVIYQSLSIRALRADIAPQRNTQALVAVVMFGLFWELTKSYTGVSFRILFFAALALMALFWQLYEILRHQQTSNQIKIIRYLIVGEIFFILLRIFAIADVGVRIVRVEDLPVLGLFSVWVMYALKIIVYGGMVAYWTEQMGMEKAKIEYEAWQFKELNQKQAALIADLGRLNKTATAGVMAASIAHELSQPLQSLTLHVGLC